MHRRLRPAGRGFPAPRPAPARLRPRGPAPGRADRATGNLRGSDIVLALLGLALLGAACLAPGVAVLGHALAA